uniref:Tudor domain-containing protein n=1 Tax=Glossina brevipalpis TaxID=37001 RepID=A0A1A9VZT2_9MUSC
MQNSTPIIITHFINPYMFWYHETSRELPQFNELEQQLQMYKNERVIDFLYNPNVGENVAINFIAWGKVIRAEILNNIKNPNEFIAWASDYGYDRIRFGGLANNLPAEIVYDSMQNKTVMMMKYNWRQNACIYFEKLLIGAASLIFIEQFQS